MMIMRMRIKIDDDDFHEDDAGDDDDVGWKGLIPVMGSRVTGVTYYGGDDDDDGDEDDGSGDDAGNADDGDDAGDEDDDVGWKGLMVVMGSRVAD